MAGPFAGVHRTNGVFPLTSAGRQYIAAAVHGEMELPFMSDGKLDGEMLVFAYAGRIEMLL